MFNPESRIVTLVGHYGSGKSEIAINLALILASNHNGEVYLADLDIVNPYFRSRERTDYLTEQGIKVISSAEVFSGVDLPYMPESLMTLLQDESLRGIIDAGGDPAGAKVLARYAEKLREVPAEILFVVNGNRPLSKTVEDTVKYIKNIEASSGLKVTGLVNNTHLLGHTAPEDIEKGAILAAEVSQSTGIPIVCHAVEKEVLAGLDEEGIAKLEKHGSILPMEIHLKKPWE